MPRVTAYCRVSTDKDDQKNSLENQEGYFKTYINNNPNWVYVPLYADGGISGTSTKKRKAFNRMMEDAHAGKFDLILTKEVSRFARNTVDTLDYTRRLKGIGVGVIFLGDNINTLDSDGELRLSIMASIAQEESRKTSERVKFGHRQSMKNGTVFGHTVLGYKIHDGSLDVDPAGAATVNMIFDKYLDEGKGLSTIAKELEMDGVLTGYGKNRWDATAVLRILTNEKYCGDLKQGKFVTPNYLTHKTKRNKGGEEFIIIKNHHEPIISRDRFNMVQAEIARRGVLADTDKTRYTNRYPFSGKLRCGSCGGIYVSRNSTNASGTQYKRWGCKKKFLYGTKHRDSRGCDSLMVRNEILEQVFLTALKDVSDNMDAVVNELVRLLDSVLDTDSITDEYAKTQKEINKIQTRLNKTIDLCLDGAITSGELKNRREPMDKQLAQLNEQLNQLSNNATLVNEREAILATLKDRVSSVVNAEAFSGDVADELLHEIVIHDKSTYDVYFKDTEEGFFLRAV